MSPISTTVSAWARRSSCCPDGAPSGRFQSKQIPVRGKTSCQDERLRSSNDPARSIASPQSRCAENDAFAARARQSQGARLGGSGPAEGLGREGVLGMNTTGSPETPASAEPPAPVGGGLTNTSGAPGGGAGRAARMGKVAVTAALVGFGLYACSDLMFGRMLGAITGTTQDPRSVGWAAIDSMKPVRATLRTQDGRTLVFEAPGAYYRAIPRGRAFRDGEGEQMMFSVWSHSFDPTRGVLMRSWRGCAQDAARPGCEDRAEAQRRIAAGEKEITIELGNWLAPQHHLTSRPSFRDQAAAGHCTLTTDPVSGLWVFDVPEALRPEPGSPPQANPYLCGKGIGWQGELNSMRQADGSYKPYYALPRYFVKEDPLDYRIRCNAVHDEMGISTLCSLYSSYKDLNFHMLLNYSERSIWDQQYRRAIALLDRFNISSQR